MRYIEKLEPPIVFKEAEDLYYSRYDNLDTMNNRELRNLFKNFKTKAKLKSNEESKNFCLKNEQKSLCAYCEKVIESNQEDSHIEHIIPIALNPSLIFKYENLIISCNGTCDEDENQQSWDIINLFSELLLSFITLFSTAISYNASFIYM